MLTTALQLSFSFHAYTSNWLVALVSLVSLGAALLSAMHSFHANDLAPNNSAANNSLVQPQACPSATNMTSLYGSGLLGSGGNVVPISS